MLLFESGKQKPIGNVSRDSNFLKLEVVSLSSKTLMYGLKYLNKVSFRGLKFFGNRKYMFFCGFILRRFALIKESR